MKGLVINLTCRGSTIYMYVRGEDKKKYTVIVNGFKPYFYVPDLFGEYTAIDGEQVTKVVLDDPGKVPLEREKYDKHYEADVKFVRRFLIDKNIYKCVEFPSTEVDHSEINGVECNVEPRYVIIDIEVKTEGIGKIPDPENPEREIIAISIYDSYLDKYITWIQHPRFDNRKLFDGKIKINARGSEYIVNWELRGFTDEESMLKDFISYWKTARPDIIMGWNIFEFDLKYLKNRLYTLSLIDFQDLPRDYDIIDCLYGYKVIGPNRHSYRLKWISYVEGIEDRDEAKEGLDIILNYEKDPLSVAYYNLRDVWRVYMINEKYKMMSYFLELKWVSGIESVVTFLSPQKDNPRKIFKPLVLIETLLRRIAKEENIVLPSHQPREKERYPGAYVFTPIKGIHENVAVFDMSRYYPSLIISFNISPETKLKKIDGEKWIFSQDREGLLPKLAKKLLKIREELEKEREALDPSDPRFEAIENKIKAVKFLINAIYGATGKEHFLLFDIDVAKTITALGREGILFIANQSEQMGYKVIYGDTDSIFIQVPFEKAPELAEKLSALVREYFKKKYNLPREPVIKLKFEKYYEKIFFKEAKKRYAGLLVWKKGKKVRDIDIVGFEAVKSDYPPLTHEFQRELITLILTEGVDREKIRSLVKKYVEEAKKRPLDDIAIYKTLNKPLYEYVSKQKHIKASLWAKINLGIDWKVGSRVKILHVSKVDGNLSKTDVVAYLEEEQIRGKIVIDWDKQLKAIIYDPANLILKPLGIDVYKLVSQKKSLNSYLF